MLQQQVQKQTRDNAGLKQRNDALAAEVEDLKSGEAAIEERARSELGMIKPGETFYRVVETEPRSRRPMPTTPTTDADEARSDLGGRARRRPRHALRWRRAEAVSRSRRPAAARACACSALLAHPAVQGAVVVLAEDDAYWPGWQALAGKPIADLHRRQRTRRLGAGRAGGVARKRASRRFRAGARRRATEPAPRRPRPLLERGRSDPVGAILAAPVRDTLKRAGDDGGIDGTEPRERLWRALTPQLFRRLQLTRALEAARDAGSAVTDESMAMEQQGHAPAAGRRQRRQPQGHHARPTWRCSSSYSRNDEHATTVAMAFASATASTSTPSATATTSCLAACACRTIAAWSRIPMATWCIHALCDALLGALALGDIGRHFPPSRSAVEGCRQPRLPAPLQCADPRTWLDARQRRHHRDLRTAEGRPACRGDAGRARRRPRRRHRCDQRQGHHDRNPGFHRPRRGHRRAGGLPAGRARERSAESPGSGVRADDGTCRARSAQPVLAARIRTTPEDFVVEEMPASRPAAAASTCC